MKYQFTSNNLIERIFLKLVPGLKPLFEPFLPVLQARVVMAGVKLGIFEAIGENSVSLDELCNDLILDKECLELTLRVLICAGYVKIIKGHYTLTKLAKNTLLSGKPGSLSGWIEFNYFQWDIISNLEEALKTGKILKEMTPYWAVQVQAMYETSRPIAGRIASVISVKENARRMIDIGGSHGYYGTMICRKNPPMKSTVIDSPEVIKHAEKIAEREKYSDVVDYMKGDIMKDDLRKGYYDVAFLGNVLHHYKPEENLEIVSKVQKCLSPGGTIVVWDFARPGTDCMTDLVGDGLSLFFRIASGTQCYKKQDYLEWLKISGFKEVQLQRMGGPAQCLVCGRK